jgi:hypothetical protein
MDRYWLCDDGPSPWEAVKQRAMDARQIQRNENEHERRIAANEMEKNNGNDVLGEGSRQQ